MANALKTLFVDIASAIKEKTGDTATMKPAEFPEKISGISTGTSAEILENIPIALDFSGGNQTITATDGTLVKSAIIQKPDTLTPENIAQGVNIAGIIGALAGGGGSGGSGEWVFGTGTFNPTVATEYTLTHNFGMIPDIFVVGLKGAPKLSGASYNLLGFLAISEKCFGKEIVEKGVGFGATIIPSSNMVMMSFSTIGVDTATKNSTTYFGDMTETTVKLGGLLGNLVTSTTGGYVWVALAKT